MPIRRLSDFAGTCVFAKQSPGPILCGPLRLTPQAEFTYHGLPFSQSYGDILPSSFSANHSSTLGFSPRLRVSVYGTVTSGTPLRGFSWRSALQPLAGSEDPFGIGARLKGRICLPLIAYHLTSDDPPTRRTPCSCVPPQARTDIGRYGNVDPFSIGYAFRPGLRTD